MRAVASCATILFGPDDSAPAFADDCFLERVIANLTFDVEPLKFATVFREVKLYDHRGFKALAVAGLKSISKGD